MGIQGYVVSIVHNEAGLGGKLLKPLSDTQGNPGPPNLGGGDGEVDGKRLLASGGSALWFLNLGKNLTFGATNRLESPLLPAFWLMVQPWYSSLGGLHQLQPAAAATKILIYDVSNNRPSSDVVGSVSFQDEDLAAGNIGGTVTWTLAPGADLGFTTHFEVWLSAGGNGLSQADLIANVPVGSNNASVPGGTLLGPRTTLLVFPTNPNGRSPTARSVVINDRAVTTTTTTTTSLTDTFTMTEVAITTQATSARAAQAPATTDLSAAKETTKGTRGSTTSPSRSSNPMSNDVPTTTETTINTTTNITLSSSTAGLFVMATPFPTKLEEASPEDAASVGTIGLN